ncbi:MAG: hypothetical protein VXY94_11265, partial [Planctomycetota bacterium]|nr:hypothetical protein [Planctomycetota bacterium]
MQSELRQTSEYDEFLKAARLRLMASQGACSSRHAGLLAASIEGLMAERAVSPETRERLEHTLKSMTGG